MRYMSQNADPTNRSDPCPKCGGPLKVKPRMFALVGIGHFSGLVCDTCRALWCDPEDDFLAAAAKRDAIRREFGKEDIDVYMGP